MKNDVKCSMKNIIQEFLTGILVLGMISGIIPILAVALLSNLLGI